MNELKINFLVLLLGLFSFFSLTSCKHFSDLSPVDLKTEYKKAPVVDTESPRFTYHGFRYVEVSGFRSEPRPDAITGLV